MIGLFQYQFMQSRLTTQPGQLTLGELPGGDYSLFYRFIATTFAAHQRPQLAITNDPYRRAVFL
jgi:hypothetical protein